MKTDYNNLKPSDVLAVFVAAAGIALIGVLGFSALPSEHRAHVAKAVQVLDMHEEIEHQTKVLGFWLDEAPQYALSEFYIAFTEVAVIPYDTILSWQHAAEKTQTAFYNLSDSLAVVYQKNFIDSSRQAIALAKVEQGHVLGASDTHEYDSEGAEVSVLENLIPAELAEEVIYIDDDPRDRGYRAPDLQKLFEKIKLMEE